MKPALTVILLQGLPHFLSPGRVREALTRQTLPAEQWETVTVAADMPGLTPTVARFQGVAKSCGQVLVFLQEDTIPAADFLERVARAFADTAPGALAARILPEFPIAPALWMREFDRLWELHDGGDQALRWAALPQSGDAPCLDAIVALHRDAASAYEHALAREPARYGWDDGGDLGLTVLEAGYALAYEPSAVLTRIVPPEAMTARYLGRINRRRERSAVRAIESHGLRPWPPLAPLRVPLCQAAAWLRTRAWRGPPEWVRWQGLCGRCEGRADIA